MGLNYSTQCYKRIHIYFSIYILSSHEGSHFEIRPPTSPSPVIDMCLGGCDVTGRILKSKNNVSLMLTFHVNNDQM